MPLKPVDKKKNPGLAKLPTDVRNKMGYMRDGGMANKGKKEGTEAENLKRIEEQQKAQAKRAEEASKAVKSYAREKARKMKEGGMVLEIGLRPATKSEMKMAKEMKPQKKSNGGMVARGTGQAIRGKGFKGVF